MKFFVLLAVVGLAAATHQVDEVKKAAALKLMMMNPSEMHLCSSDADCAGQEGKPKCCDLMKLCKPENAPGFDAVLAKECNDNNDCPPIYQCHKSGDKKCHMSGPKACKTNADCLQGMEHAEYECMESLKTAPGQRCYRKCSSDEVCHERMPMEAKEHLGCCHGHCQKKAAC